MAKFNAESTQIGDVATTPLRSGIARTGLGNTTSERGDDLKTATDVIKGAFEITSSIVKHNFKSNLEKLDDNSQEFTKLRQQLIEDARSSGDRAEFDKTISKLQTLDRGETAGVISPSEVRARKQALLKQNVSSFPWLAPEFKSLASVFAVGSGTGVGSSTITPEEKGLNDIREESARTGFTPSFIRDTFRAQVNNKLIIANRDNSLARGTISFPEIRQAWSATVDSIRSETLGELFVMEKQNPLSINETDWSTWLSNIEEDYKSALIGEQATLSKSGKILTPEQRNVMEKDLESGLAVAKQFVKSKDKLAFLKRQRSMLEEQGFVAISKQNPYYGFLLENGMPEKAAEFAFKTWPKFQAMISKDGNIDKIKLLAEEAGDLNAIVFLDALQFNKEIISQSIHNKLISGGSGSSKTEDVIINGMSGSWLSTPNLDNDKVLNETHQAAMNKLTNPDTPVKELKWFLKSSVVPQVATNDKWKGQIDNRTDLETAAIIAEMFTVNEDDREGWKYGIEDGEIVAVRSDGRIQKPPFAGKDSTFLPPGKDSSGRRLGGLGREFLRPILDLTIINQVKTKYGLFSESKDTWLSFVVDSLNTILPKSAEELKEIEDAKLLKEQRQRDKAALEAANKLRFKR